MKLSLLYLALSIPTYLFAGNPEIVWKRLETQFSFKDLSKTCSTKTEVGNTHVPGEAYLALEIAEGKVSAARLSNYPNTFPFTAIYRYVDLSPEEVSSIQLYQDQKNQYWVKSILLSERLLSWLVYFPAQDHFWCAAPFLPKSVTPNNIVVSFELKGVEQGIEISYSEYLQLKGKGPAEEPFSETLRIVQKIEKPSPL